MSNNDLRTAIVRLQSRADDARKNNNLADSERIERTVREYQDEMTHRL